jgi:hypothetical protein
MNDMPDPFKRADTTLDENHLRHLDALNLIKATRDGDDAAAWEILALHSASKQDLENLVRSLSWVAVMLLDGMKKGRSDGDSVRSPHFGGTCSATEVATVTTITEERTHHDRD